MIKNHAFIAFNWPATRPKTGYYEGTLSTSKRLIFIKLLISVYKYLNRLIYSDFYFKA